MSDNSASNLRMPPATCLDSGPSHFVCAVAAAIINHDDFASAIVLFCTSIEALYAVSNISVFIVGGNNYRNHGIERLLHFFVSGPSEGCRNSPNACHAYS